MRENLNHRGTQENTGESFLMRSAGVGIASNFLGETPNCGICERGIRRRKKSSAGMRDCDHFLWRRILKSKLTTPF